MKNRPLATLKLIVLMLLLMAGSNHLFAQCQQVMENGGFETGDLSG